MPRERRAARAACFLRRVEALDVFGRRATSSHILKRPPSVTVVRRLASRVVLWHGVEDGSCHGYVAASLLFVRGVEIASAILWHVALTDH